MKIYNTLYENFEQISEWILEKNINHYNKCLVTIHSSSLKDKECVLLAKSIKEILPYAVVNGCATSGVIYEGDIYDNEVLISVYEFEYGRFFSHLKDTEGLTPLEIAESIFEDSKHYPTRFGLLLFDYQQKALFEITNRLNELLPEVSFSGGVAGSMDLSGEIDSFLFDETGFYKNAYLVVFIASDHVLAYSDIISGHPPISELFTITKTENTFIDEIDNVPAIQWFSDKLGIEEFTDNGDWSETTATSLLLHFPMILEGYSSSTRFLQYHKDLNRLSSYSAVMEEGQQFRLAYLSPLKSVEELQEICHYLQMISAEMIFCYSCLFRKLFSNNIAKWELSVFKKNKICGAFMVGEIGTKEDQVQLLNGSANFFTLAEKAGHIKPDLAIFESIDSLFKENREFEQLIQSAGSKLRSNIFANYFEYEQQVKDRLNPYQEDLFGTISQFLKKQNENKKQQICLISIEDFEKHMLVLGEDEFEKLAYENREKILEYLNKYFSYYHFNFYRYDSAHFFFTIEEKITDAVYIAFLRKFYTDCGSWALLSEKVLCFNNFTFTLNGLAIQQLMHSPKINELNLDQKRFNHFDKSALGIDELNEEFQMVAALNKIIEEEAVIPYFQGIYDNKKNSFHMYEALMRLQHPDGRMLFPADFMQIAKKYDLYLPLSFCMIAKVFELFKNRNEIISINVSAYDILSERFKDFLFEKLNEMPNPSHFVFEILETELITDIELLRSFIQQLKQMGCKVAIDNFGTGYSNFLDFGNLDIDYLKLNGSLTKLLGTDFNYTHILDSIALMSEKLSVKLIAGFVETASAQKLLIESGVHFSQGFFFSKPMPYAELVVISHENILKIENETNENEEQPEKAFTQNKAKRDNLILYLGGFLVALLTVFSVTYFVTFNQKEFKRINDSFLVEIATGISDKVALFAEESKISLQIMAVAMSDNVRNFESLSGSRHILNELNHATKFNKSYISYGGLPPIDGAGNVLDVPIGDIYGRAIGRDVTLLPIRKDSKGEEILVFSANMFLDNKKIGEIYGTYRVEDVSKLLNLKSFGGEAFYHISQVDGTPIYLSGRQENAFTNGDMYDFIGSLEIFNGHTSESIKNDMIEGKTVLLNYYLQGEERSAVMVRIPDTDWCVVSIVLAEINTEMLKSNNRSTVIFIAFITILYTIYFLLITRIFRKHENVILETLEASQSLSNSLQLSIEKDSLTGTYSRATAIEKISNSISSLNDKKSLHALAILDIDNFKYINDTYGHHTGDIYLQSFVSAVKLAIKPGCILGRLGGDEFLLFLNDMKDKEEVKSIFNSIFNNIHAIHLGGVDLEIVSVSAGIILISNNAKTYEELMIEADNTLYKAKREGKNKYLFYEDLYNAMTTR